MAAHTMDKYTLPAGKSKHEFSVPHVSGLRVSVSTKNKTFMHRYTFDGKKHCVVLGKHPEMSLIEAISQVQENHQKIAQGINPNQSKVADHSQDVLFRHFAQNVYLPAVKPHKKSYWDDESRIRIHLIPTLGKRKLSDITSVDLSQLLAKKQQEEQLSNATVNRVRALLSSIFNLALDHDLILINPVSRVKKFKENNQIERYLTEGELKRLVDVLTNPSQFDIQNLRIVSIVKFLLLTGVRKREAMDIQWSDVNLATGEWLLKQNKSGKARRISLSKDALGILQRLPKIGTYIFANPLTQKPYADIRKTFEKIMKAADINQIRIHDLRHNFASLAVNSGESLYVVQRLLGHASPQTTQRYAHLQQSTLRDASEKIAHVISSQAI